MVTILSTALSKEFDMPSRELSFPVFDADNHMYETEEALTKFLPDNRKHLIDYVQVGGRKKIVVRGHISDYIPNPTFEVVARPGQGQDHGRQPGGPVQARAAGVSLITASPRLATRGDRFVKARGTPSLDLDRHNRMARRGPARDRVEPDFG
jgi:hypothetical protein